MAGRFGARNFHGLERDVKPDGKSPELDGTLLEAYAFFGP